MRVVPNGWRHVAGALLATALFVIGPLVIAAGTTACDAEGRACAPGDFRYCACTGLPPGRLGGYQQCLDDASKYGACDCSGTVPAGAGILVEAGAAPEASVPDSGLLGFLEPCERNEQCTTGNCFGFNAFGPHCTQPCTKDIDCPAPSPGCSNNGVCKLR